MNVVLDIRRAQTIETAVSSDLERAVNELQAAREPAAWLAELWSGCYASACVRVIPVLFAGLALRCVCVVGIGYCFFPYKLQQASDLIAHFVIGICRTVVPRSTNCVRCLF